MQPIDYVRFMEDHNVLFTTIQMTLFLSTVLLVGLSCTLADHGKKSAFLALAVGFLSGYAFYQIHTPFHSVGKDIRALAEQKIAENGLSGNAWHIDYSSSSKTGFVTVGKENGKNGKCNCMRKYVNIYMPSEKLYVNAHYVNSAEFDRSLILVANDLW